MNFTNSTKRFKKNCLLVFRNKKLNIFGEAGRFIDAVSASGYYFDKIAYIAYDSSEEIVRAVKDGKENYENLFLFCPYEMGVTLKNYIKNLYSSEFNELGILRAQDADVFIFYSDRENRLLYDDIKNILDKKYGVEYARSCVKTVGAPSALINTAIEKAKSILNETHFNVSEKYGECRIEAVYPRNVSKTGYDTFVRSLMTDLNQYVYAMEDTPLEEIIFQLLKLRRMKISVAESFTGGGVGKRLVDVSGISEVYKEGLNTYSNESKISRLGVSEITLKHYGAVSEETAREMAQGLLKTGKCDISVATTGIAGPKSDNTLKPVGLCYIAVGTHENIAVYKYNLNGDRETITNTAINLALFHTYKTLK